MTLIDDVANYLDGAGRIESQALTQSASVAYTAATMELTTRLMQLASWLLLQRAVNDGEITSDQASAERAKVAASTQPPPTDAPEWEALPETLQDLVLRSLRLRARAQYLDGSVSARREAQDGNPVNRQHRQIEEAFAAGRKQHEPCAPHSPKV
jgi:regulator of CtrA degradation